MGDAADERPAAFTHVRQQVRVPGLCTQYSQGGTCGYARWGNSGFVREA
jgi:hypothetical protein